MDSSQVLLDVYGRIPPIAHEVVGGLSNESLVWAPAPGANTIAWLVWHSARVEDDHVAEVMGTDQVWADPTWAPRFGVAPDLQNTGYGHGPADVATVRPRDGSDLLAYLDAVHDRTLPFLAGLEAPDLDRVVDRRWDPPVTLGVRLMSVAADGLEHLGQAAYLKGLLER